jgi:neutral trehalase
LSHWCSLSLQMQTQYRTVRGLSESKHWKKVSRFVENFLFVVKS